MRLSRPCYDKPHRCPGWAGGGWKFPKKDRCVGGYIALHYERAHPHWRFGRCNRCDVVTTPFALRRLDPRYYYQIMEWVKQHVLRQHD